MPNQAVYGQKTIRDREGAVDSVYKSQLDSLRILKDSLITNEQNVENIPDSLKKASDDVDTMLKDSTNFPTAVDDEIKTPLNYEATDSIVYDIEEGVLHLYGNAYVKYDDIELKAHYIKFKYEDKTVVAKHGFDADGNKIGRPVLIENGKEYSGDEMAYNFESRKGRISDLLTSDDQEGYIRGAEVKKNEFDELFAEDAYYTTCDLDHPHFKINVDKVKIIPDKLIVSGPANLVIADVPTPLVLPFALFPIDRRRSSGIIFPSYGESPQLGFFLTDGGYYWAVNDYMDLAVMGDIYTSRSWSISVASQYRVRYRYSGRVRLEYGKTFLNDPITPDFSNNNLFSFNWNHSQDAKARPNSKFSANVNIASSNFQQSFGNNQTANVLNNTLNSSISYSFQFPNSPFSLNLAARHNQNINTKAFNISLPEASLNMRPIYPFERKQRLGSKKWYENIRLGYTMDVKNELRTFDSLLLKRSTYDEFNFGVRHRATLNTNIKFLKYFVFNPNVNYTERWYLRSVNKVFVQDSIPPGSDEASDFVRTDSIRGFVSPRDFTAGGNLTTKLFGMVNFKKGKLKAIRHVITPQVGFSYRPDFGDESWDYYRTLMLAESDSLFYSRYEGSIFGSPPRGEQRSLTYNINNQLEFKVRTPKDSVNEDKKIEIFRNLRASGSYNFAADSFKMSNITLSGNTNLLNRFNINLNASFDPYTFVDSLGRRVETFEWSANRKPVRFRNASFNLTTRFGDKDFENFYSDRATEGELWELNEYPERFLDFNKQWGLGLNYSLRLNKIYRDGPDSLAVTQIVNTNFDINLTPKWKVSGNTGYDFTRKEISFTNINVTRDLHCWQMTFNWVPVGIYKSYNFRINVKAAVLQDLKLTRRRQWYDL